MVLKVKSQGNPRMFRKFILLIVAMVGFYSSVVFPIGLGDYKLESRLNQPLKAEIKLLSSGDMSEHELKASLANARDFEKVGVARLRDLSQIRFKTVRGEGGLILKLSTRKQVKEPFLNFLVEINWPNGRMIREYTFLLDPPIFEDSKSSTIKKTFSNTTSQVKPRGSKNNYADLQKNKKKAFFSGSSYGPVGSNDTLWSIAAKTRPNSQVSIQQNLVAIYRANPDAFADGNINNLLKGRVLQIPDAETVRQIPHRAALQDVVMQNRKWKSGGARRIVGSNNKSSSNKKTMQGSRLSLATPDNESQGNANKSNGMGEKLATAQADLVRSQEKSATLSVENEQLRERLAEVLKKLESIDSDDKAVNIASSQLTALTQLDNKGEKSTSVNEDNIIDEANKKDSSLLDDNATDVTASSETSSDQGANESANVKADEIIKDDQKNNATTDLNEDKKQSSKKSLFAKKKEKDLFSQVMDYLNEYWQIILAVIGVLLLLIFWRMQKRMSDHDFKDDLVMGVNTGEMGLNDPFDLPDVGDDMMDELGLDGSDNVNVADDEADPIGEADIYIAYGKLDQAEKLLLNAINDNPVRSDLKVKLMECYAELKDKSRFESLAQEVSQGVDSDEWQIQIDSLRSKFWPDDSNESESFELPSTEDIFNDDDFDFDSSPNVDDTAATVVDDANLDEVNLDDANLNDLSADEFSLDDELSLDTGDDISDDFDLDLNFDDEDVKVAAEPKVEADTFDLESDDISLDDDSLDDGFSFDDDDLLSDDSLSDDSIGDEADEIATKLDLARAYIDMGDADGAKEILDEVLAEGTDEQKAEANALLNK